MRRVILAAITTLLTMTIPIMARAADSLRIDMVFVKGGCYQMGDTFGDGNDNEKPAHEVCVNDFYMGKYKVTQEQWQSVMGENPSRYQNCGGDCPVEQVSWDDAQKFIANLNRLTGKNYRLPTEAEWEYAARSGGKKEKWAGTNSVDSLGDYAWYEKNAGGITHNKVGLKKPNGLGLYDMSGNVWEWMQDWYEEGYYENSPRNNPTGPERRENRVLRGGSWCDDALGVRSACRHGSPPGFKYSVIGFRLLLPAK